MYIVMYDDMKFIHVVVASSAYNIQTCKPRTGRKLQNTNSALVIWFVSCYNIYFILCQISILYVISLNPGKRKKRPDAG
jgi:hypothetical protein